MSNSNPRGMGSVLCVCVRARGSRVHTHECWGKGSSQNILGSSQNIPGSSLLICKMRAVSALPTWQDGDSEEVSRVRWRPWNAKALLGIKIKQDYLSCKWRGTGRRAGRCPWRLREHMPLGAKCVCSEQAGRATGQLWLLVNNEDYTH